MLNKGRLVCISADGTLLLNVSYRRVKIVYHLQMRSEQKKSVSIFTGCRLLAIPNAVADAKDSSVPAVRSAPSTFSRKYFLIFFEIELRFEIPKTESCILLQEGKGNMNQDLHAPLPQSLCKHFQSGSREKPTLLRRFRRKQPFRRATVKTSSSTSNNPRPL